MCGGVFSAHAVTRLGYMLHCKGIPPERILTVTYTVAATRDMKARFISFFGEGHADKLTFRTINGLCAGDRDLRPAEGNRAICPTG